MKLPIILYLICQKVRLRPILGVNPRLLSVEQRLFFTHDYHLDIVYYSERRNKHICYVQCRYSFDIPKEYPLPIVSLINGVLNYCSIS